MKLKKQTLERTKLLNAKSWRSQWPTVRNWPVVSPGVVPRGLNEYLSRRRPHSHVALGVWVQDPYFCKYVPVHSICPLSIFGLTCSWKKNEIRIRTTSIGFEKNKKALDEQKSESVIFPFLRRCIFVKRLTSAENIRNLVRSCCLQPFVDIPNKCRRPLFFFCHFGYLTKKVATSSGYRRASRRWLIIFWKWPQCATKMLPAMTYYTSLLTPVRHHAPPYNTVSWSPRLRYPSN